MSFDAIVGELFSNKNQLIVFYWNALMSVSSNNHTENNVEYNRRSNSDVVDLQYVLFGPPLFQTFFGKSSFLKNDYP